MNYYRHYIGDYLRDTADLSLAEHGAYCLLLNYYYADERPLPGEHRTIYRRLRAMGRDEQAAIDAVLSRFFHRTDDGYHQKRVDYEIGVSAKARINGKGGGRPRTEHETGTITGIETGLQTGEETGTITENITGSGHPTNHQPTSNQSTNHHPPSESRAEAVRSRGSRLPPDWKFPDDWKAWASEKRPDLDPEITAERFRDFWIAKAGKDGRKLDWHATWRNWVRNERAAGGNGKDHAPPWWSSDAAIQAKAAELGMAAKPGESWQQLRGRIDERLHGGTR